MVTLWWLLMDWLHGRRRSPWQTRADEQERFERTLRRIK